MKDEGPFEYGALYEVLEDFEALRERFEAGQRAWYWRMAFSRYDGFYGYFFRSEAGTLSWDVGSQEEARSRANTRFRKVRGPHPIIAAAENDSQDPLAGVDFQKAHEVERELALERAAELGHVDFVGSLLSAMPTSPEHQFRLWMQAARASKSRVVELLLHRGQDVGQQDRSGQTALIMAAASGDLDTVRLLLEHGANPVHVTKAGVTPLRLAEAHRHSEVIALLREAATRY